MTSPPERRARSGSSESDAVSPAVAAAAAQPGYVYFVGAGPGDPGLITLRGAELLATADVVVHDDLVDPSALAGARADAVVRGAGPWGAVRASAQGGPASIEADLVALARAGHSVVRLEGDDSFLFGRGSEEAEALRAAGVPFEVVPGVSSPFGVAAYAGIPLTHGNLASSVTFVSGTTPAGDAFDGSELAGVRGTICVLKGMDHLEEVTRGLVERARRDPATPAAAISWGTSARQVVVTDRLDAIAARARAEGLGSPGVVVVGEVVARREALRWFDARPLFGKRVLVTRPKGQIGPTASLLRLRGAEAIAFSTIEIVAPPDPARVADAVRALATYDLVAFTSENGVEWLWREIDAQRRDARAFGAARVAAIGTGTAAALAARGVRADLVPEAFVGEALARAILDDLATRAVPGRAPRVLVPRARVAREVIPAMLREAGVEVDVVPVYETRPADAGRKAELTALFEADGVDVVLLTSSSTADSLVELLGPRAAELTARTLVASIGPITTATAEKRGLRVGVTAAVSTTAGLVEAVERHLGAAR